jgi:hypothetical protein
MSRRRVVSVRLRADDRRPVAALSLAHGIGADTAIFSLLNSLLLRALPAKEPERLVTISSDAAIRMGFKAGLG